MNDDGYINVLDIQSMINILLESYSPTAREYWSADVNNDKKIDVSDIQKAVNKFLGID